MTPLTPFLPTFLISRISDALIKGVTQVDNFEKGQNTCAPPIEAQKDLQEIIGTIEQLGLSAIKTGLIISPRINFKLSNAL